MEVRPRHALSVLMCFTRSLRGLQRSVLPMQLGLFLIFVAVPLIEIAILIKLGQWIGFGWTLFIVIATAIAGTYVLHTQGLQVIKRAVESLSKGKAPIAPIVDGSFLMIAGALLLTPGLLTDVAGLLLLIPPVRHVVARWSMKKVLGSATLHGATFGPDAAQANGQTRPESATRDHNNGASQQGPVIEGEFERLDERTIDPNRPKGQQRGG
jgi:UPF0716 protein FxsA